MGTLYSSIERRNAQGRVGCNTSAVRRADVRLGADCALARTSMHVRSRLGANAISEIWREHETQIPASIDSPRDSGKEGNRDTRVCRGLLGIECATCACGSYGAAGCWKALLDSQASVAIGSADGRLETLCGSQGRTRPILMMQL